MEIIYLSLQRHHQNDSCVKMGSDESRFNVSLIVRDKVTRQCPQPQEQLCPFLSKQWYGSQFGDLYRAHRCGCMRLHTGAALEVDWDGGKNLYHTGDSNSQCQYCVWIFSLTLYQLSFSSPRYFLV